LIDNKEYPPHDILPLPVSSSILTVAQTLRLATAWLFFSRTIVSLPSLVTSNPIQSFSQIRRIYHFFIRK